jgi:uncharacterized protein YbcI
MGRLTLVMMMPSAAIPKGSAMKSRGELEADLAQVVARFQKEAFGRGPVETRAVLRDGLAFAYSRGVLTAAEARLAQAGADPPDGELIRQLRRRVVDHGRGELRAAIEGVLGVAVRAVLVDASPETDEAAFVFTLDRPVECRPNGTG